jgi:prevent-host-death family protein
MTMISGAYSAMKTKTMAAGAFKVHCLKVMDEVQAKRQAVLITKRGKPVAKLVPVEKEKDDIFGFLKGKGRIEIKGDIVSPAFSPEEWGDLY